MQIEEIRDVLSEMGAIQLQFIWMSSDRMVFRYANHPRTFPSGRKWKKLHSQMEKGMNCFAILTTLKPAKQSISGYSYDCLGVLATFADMKELQDASNLYWNHTKVVDGKEKEIVMLNMCESIKTFITENERPINHFNYVTHELAIIAVEEGVKNAKTIAKML